MKNYDQLINKLTEETNDQLKLGKKIEAEHQDLYTFFSNFCRANGLKMPITEDRFFEKIAEAHLREIKDYYTRLKQMEDAAKKSLK